MLRKAGAGGLSYEDWQAQFPKDIRNALGTRHYHLRWDHERGRIGIAKDRGPDTPSPFNNILADIEKIESDASSDATTKQRLIEARVGQGKFRKALMQRWGDACAVTGIAQSQLLRASHIKEWAKSSNKERLDPSNGLLLSANIDALFDQGLVSLTPTAKR